MLGSRLVMLVAIAVAVLACTRRREERSATTTTTFHDHDADEGKVAWTNPAPYIPPQCYARTAGEDGRRHNTCFTCHAQPTAPNYLDDQELQIAYVFPPFARRNPWSNLFVDRSAAVAAISDAEILAYVRHDNYRTETGNRIAPKLTTPPAAWDADGDGCWGGWFPDVAMRFDERGFDRGSDGGYTGWRAYAYYPVPGAFWPANGSFGDALVRLPAVYRETRDGRFDRAVYEINLAILESLIARRDVAIDPVDEAALGVDLDGDGALATATRVHHRDRPDGGGLSWVGAAGRLQASGDVSMAVGLFPKGAELAHSLRYLDVAGGRVRMAPRMKELRYMIKTEWKAPGTLAVEALMLTEESYTYGNGPRPVGGDAEGGADNAAGWRIQGFIEDATGELRPQTAEEQAACIGCHGGVGVTDDSVFSFGRKLPGGPQRGWVHTAQRALDGVAEPRRADGVGEYVHYLTNSGGGDELRGNREIAGRFLDARGQVRPAMAARVARDISILLVPSPGRALQLDKAYRLIVTEQSFVRGRDPTVTPPPGVYHDVPSGDRPTMVEVIADRRQGRALVYPGLPKAPPQH